MSTKKDKIIKIISFRTDEEHQDEKITSFRTTESTERKLKKDLYRQNITKKEWLDEKIRKTEHQAEISLNESEKFITIPVSDYSELLKESRSDHASFISQRIRNHVGKTDFDSTFEDILNFCNLNNLVIARLKFEDDHELIYLNHNIGDEFSSFVCRLITDLLSYNKHYFIISSNYDPRIVQFRIGKTSQEAK